jgi:hypothetical protein
MARFNFPFIGQSYQARSINESSERAINCYPEVGKDGTISAMYGTPGTVLRTTYEAGPIRGMIAADGLLWAVSGRDLIIINSDHSTEYVGTLTTSYGKVSMASSSQEVMVVDGEGGYVVNLLTFEFTPISDVDFPNGVKHITYLGGYFIVAGDGTGRFYINEHPNSGLEWNGTDFATAEGAPDNTASIIANHQELWILGTQSTEVWVHTGNASFPFERSTNVFIEHGMAAEWSVEQLDNTIFWLGSDRRGDKVVFRANGYVPERVSTHAIEYCIGKYETIEDSFSFAYQQEGHYFYVLTFPTGNTTWVYDVAVGAWHQRAWFNSLDGKLYAWRPSCHAFAYGKHYVGDASTGQIYSLEMDVYTDNGGPIKRLRSAANISEKQFLQFFSMLQIQMETGVGNSDCSTPTLVLRYSNDAGHSWSYESRSPIGRIGVYDGRAIWWRLGMGRNRVWEISTTDPVKFALLGAVLEGEVGTS